MLYSCIFQTYEWGYLLYNDMLWVVMNMLCFVSFLIMICWNLHMPVVEIYTSSVNVVLMVYWNLCIPAYGKNWNLHIAWLFSLNLVWIWTQNVGCHCIIVIKHGLLFCDVNAWVGMHWLWPAAGLRPAWQAFVNACPPMH